MVELPSGTVTFLFTDIEGSTRLLKQLGERYGEVLDAHRRILREAVEAREGREVDTQGDSFFFAFARANAALGAAVAAQRALAEHEWPEGAQLCVRMGLHTGEPAVGDERYVGLGVHRAARIGAAAHGGQVLLSSATRELVEEEKHGVVVRELGSYRLKDIDRPERLFQLDIEGLQTDFPLLRADKVAEPRPLRRRAILLAALAGVIAAAVAIPIFAFGQRGGAGGAVEVATGDSVGVIDSGSGKLVADVGVGATPTRIAFGVGAYWVANADGHSVSRIDPATNRQVETIPVGSGPSGIAVGNGAVWVTNGLDGTVSKIDPGTNTVVQTIDVGNGPVGVIYAAGLVWVANTGDGTVTRIDASSGTPGKPLPIAASGFAFGAGTLWASQRVANRVVRIDPVSGKVVAAIQVGNGPSGIAFGSSSAWVANTLDGTLSRIDPETNSVTSVIQAGNGPTSVAVDPRGIWVSNQFGGTLVRIDARTNQPGRPISVGNRPQGVTVAGGNVLVALRESGAGHRGGILTLRSDLPARFNPLDSIDTAVSYSTATWPLLGTTGDGLVAYNHVSGLAGTQLVPDLAVSLPAPTDGGKTYAFRLRAGIRYSNGKLVKASDFRATIERDFEVGLPVTYYTGIVGADRCKPKRPCDLSRGIVTEDGARTVVVRLVGPDPEFLYKLAIPFAYVVPAGAPPHDVGTHPLAGTGPYMITSYRPRSVLRLVRNPYFHEWSQAAQPDGYPDELVLRIGGGSDAALGDVLQGRADVAWTVEPYSQAQVTKIETRYASQAHVNPAPATLGLFLNTRVPPFDKLDVRRAVNYAVDRAAAIRANGGNGEPTCQTLPRNFPGYRAYCPYTAGAEHDTWTAPDLAKARALVARSGTRGMKVTVWAWTQAQGFNTTAVKLLESLGYRVSTKVLGQNYLSAVADSRNRAQIGFVGWQPDYPTPSAFFRLLFTCASFRPGNLSNTNAAEFCDPSLDRQIERASRLQATDPTAALSLWQRVDSSIANRAPWVPLFNPTALDVVSKRVSNYQYSPGSGMLFDQLWVH